MKIKNCPHCGARHEDLDKDQCKGVYPYNDAPGGKMQSWIHVVCLECGASAPTVEKWNRRKLP